MNGLLRRYSWLIKKGNVVVADGMVDGGALANERGDASSKMSAPSNRERTAAPPAEATFVFSEVEQTFGDCSKEGSRVPCPPSSPLAPPLRSSIGHLLSHRRIYLLVGIFSRNEERNRTA